MKASLIFALALVAVTFVCLSFGEHHSFTHAVSNLGRYQTAGGGFVLSLDSGVKPTLEATSHALLLSSLFGLKKKINANEVPRYIQTLENGDYGYGKSAGMASDLESVRHAVMSYQHLGLTIPNSGNVATFIRSLHDAETHLFASRVGETGDLKSTALAFQTLEYLGELQRAWVQDMVPSIKAYLAKHLKMGNELHFQFNEPALSVISANYYGIVLGSYVGTDFVNPSKWASFILSHEDKKNGGFGTLEDTVHAVSSLRILQQLKAAEKPTSFVDLVGTEKLTQYVSNIPRDLRSAAQAHLAVALTKSFTENFETTISYEVLRSSVSVDKRIVQGSQLKPVLSVRTVDGVAHAGLDVEVSITYEGSKAPVTAKLQWKENEQYASDDFFETAGHLGAMTFNFVIRCYVVGVGEISFEKTDVKQIGYGLMVDSQAHLDVTGKEFKEGETVATGTEFKFGLTLQNHTHEQLVSGDFDVIFSVLDSSSVAVHTSKVNGKTNSAPIAFSYVLKNSNLPSGHLSFRFDVANARGVHTTEVVVYQLSFPMIATAITFEGFKPNDAPSYKVGETVRVSIEPATFPDLRNVYGYPATDVNGKNVAGLRRFMMDVSSPTGSLLRTVTGEPKAVAAGQNSKYQFEVPVSPSLDSFGSNIVSFRYLTDANEEVSLGNYDSFYGELYEDSSVLNYTVSGELYMVEVKEQPKTHDFYYGNDINYRFRVKDSVSGKYIEKGSDEQANIYLALQHKDEGRARLFTSAVQAASEVVVDGVKQFAINWAINPNAVQGLGFLTLSAKDADGNHLPLYAEGTKKQTVNYDVNIGGNITVSSSPYSTFESTYEQTVFVVQFNLSCQEKSLKDAQLRCSVVYDEKTVVSLLPAATNDAGVYSVSWTLPHAESPSGDYSLKCFRETDRKRALEARELQEKKRRLEEELKQFEEEGKNATSTNKEAGVEESLDPLFVVTVRHFAPYTGKIPLRTELLAAVVFGGLFFWASYQKKKYLPATVTN